MASNTLSVYVKSPLYEKIRAAHEDKDNPFDYRKICNEALELALYRTSAPGQPKDQEQSMPSVPDTSGAIDLSNPETAADLARQASEIEYQVGYSNTTVDFQAFLDSTARQGAWPISAAPTIDGKILWVVAWPKVLTEPDQT